jgi:hypothetical protein
MMSHVDARRGFVAAAIVLACVFGLVYYAKAIVDLDDRADANSALSFSDREIAGGNSIVIDQEAANEAEVLIPKAATFRVRVGPRLRHATPLTSTYVESWYRYFLMPRRPALDARWVICYGCAEQELANYTVLWRDPNGIAIGRRR